MRQSRLVKSNQNFPIDYHDNRHAHLTGLVYHLLALVQISRHVEVIVSDAISLEERLGHIAIDAGRRGIYDYVFHMVDKLS